MEESIKKTALVTGVTGQDGAYLAQFLLSKGYHVYGAHRRSASLNLWRVKDLGIPLNEKFKLIELDLTDLSSCIRVIKAIKPDEVYNLAAQSHVATSFNQPITTSEINGIGVLNMLEAIRLERNTTKYYQASSSEMFGKVQEIPQTEDTPFYPRSPYGVAKLYAHWMTVNYRESYNIFATSGILFNHESPLRGLDFVTRKITSAVARISLGSKETIELGNLDSERDWGFARDYVEGMYMMMQADYPDTFVLATNRTETVRTFATLAFQAAGISVRWTGQGKDEVGVNGANGATLVTISPVYYRPAEVDILIGDSSKSKRVLGWRPHTNLEALVKMMVEADIERSHNVP